MIYMGQGDIGSVSSRDIWRKKSKQLKIYNVIDIFLKKDRQGKKKIIELTSIP